MSKLEFIVVVAAAMLASCTAEPPQTLMQPVVKTLTGEAGYDSAHLEATLENVDNLTSAGVYL